MAVRKLKGQEVSLAIDGAVVAASTSCTISYTMNTEDVSSKDDESFYFENPDATTLGWSVQNESFVASVSDVSRMLRLYIDRAAVRVEATDGGGQVSLRGDAYITSLSVDATNGEYAKMSLTLEGTGSDLIDE